MFAAYVKSKISVHGPAEQIALPEAVFQFITFEEEDFDNKEATVLSFAIVPEHVYVTLKTGDNLDKALAAVKAFNPHVIWELGALNFIDHPTQSAVLVKQQLRIVEILNK